MQTMISRFCFVAICFLVGCSTTEKVYHSPGYYLKTKDPRQFSKKTKIFLLATSRRGANFAQELVDQKKIWLKAGYRENEIACYYIIPSTHYLHGDLEQYQKLAKDLTQCYHASPKILKEHLALASQERKDFLFLYLTSHGDNPLSRRVNDLGRSPLRALEDKILLESHPVFDEYHLVADALPDGQANFDMKLGALRSGVEEEDLFITPRLLRGQLKRHYTRTPKFIVIQGCHTGGFIEDDRPEFSSHTLKGLQKITVLTASRYDRQSFGCGLSEKTTFFGGAFNENLERSLTSPLKMDWKKFHLELSEQISDMESGYEPSLPQYFSNTQFKPAK